LISTTVGHEAGGAERGAMEARTRQPPASLQAKLKLPFTWPHMSAVRSRPSISPEPPTTDAASIGSVV